MRPEDLSDERLDEILRRQPRWEPPRHFARAVIARLPALSAVPRTIEPSYVPIVLRSLEVGAAGALFAYAGGVLLLRATPVLIEHATLVGWVTAAVTLSIAAVLTARDQQWI